jgi:DNA polymerase
MKIIGDKISFLGINQYTKKWGVIKTFSGKLCENITSGTSRDVLFYSMPRIEAAGYEIALHVHDECVCQAPDEEKYSHAELSKIMSQGFEWSKGLPLAAAGFESYRYRKD